MFDIEHNTILLQSVVPRILFQDQLLLHISFQSQIICQRCKDFEQYVAAKGEGGHFMHTTWTRS